MPKVSGILETALYVDDPARSAAFYRNLFGFKTLLEADRLIALNVADRNVLLLFQKGATAEPAVLPGGVIPPHGGDGSLHFAFSVGPEEIDPWADRLRSEGIAIEGTVDWPGGFRSLYFRDPDNHLVELITAGYWSFGSGASDHTP